VEVAAFLVVLDPGLHPDTVEATIAAIRQLRGVAGVTTFYDDVGTEIVAIHQIREDVRRRYEEIKDMNGVHVGYRQVP
jgi:hypothetical protein